MNMRRKPSPAVGQTFAAMVFLAVSCLVLYGVDGIHLQAAYNNVEKPNVEGKLELVLDESSASPLGGTLAIRNRGNRAVLYGAPYRLERYENDEWTHLKPVDSETGGWFLVGHLLPPGRQISLNVQWSTIWGSLPEGRYRLTKDFFVESEVFDEDGSDKDFIKTAEFTISQDDE